MAANACIGYLRGAYLPELCWPQRGLHAEIARAPGMVRGWQRRGLGWNPQWEEEWLEQDEEWAYEEWALPFEGEEVEGTPH